MDSVYWERYELSTRGRPKELVNQIMTMRENLVRLVGDDARIFEPQIYVPAVYGTRPTWPDENGLRLFLENPLAYYATHYGVTVEQFVAWFEEDRSVRCAAKTRSGRRCKNVVTGGYSVDPAEWVKMQGGYCSVHSREHA